MLFHHKLFLHRFLIVTLLLLAIFEFNIICGRLNNATKMGSSPLFDNGVLGEPILFCGAGHISFKFVTKSRFLGRVFLKGMSSSSSVKKKQEKSPKRNCEIRAEEACLVGLKSAKSSNSSVNTTISEAFANSSQFCSMRIPFDGDDQGCPSLNRRRIIGQISRGMQVSATVVISFHPHFITQMDKMYHLQCFYGSRNTKDESEADQMVIDGKIQGGTMSKVKAAFHVQSADSKQSKSDFLGGKLSKMPVCKYEILENNADGPLASLSISHILTKQTQQFYHKWSCELGVTEKHESSALCFRVHSCLAQSPSTKQLVILDKEGCSLDKFLLNNLQYTVEESNGRRKLVAGQFSQVSKYTDQRSMYLQCQIKLWRLPLGELICPDYNKFCPNPKHFGGFQQVLEEEQVVRPRRFSEGNLSE